MIYFAVIEEQRSVLRDYLASWGRSLAGRMTQLTYHELLQRRSMPRGAWIFSNLEHLSSAGLDMAEHCWRAAAEAGFPVLNRPSQVLRRYELLDSLHRAGINRFRAVRADESPDGLRYPVFVRHADEHSGNHTPLLHDRSELNQALAYMRKRGRRLCAYLIVEFCETAGSDGLYRKYSVYRIGDRYVPGHIHIGRKWMMKSTSQVRTEQLAAESLDFVRSDPHGAWVRDVFERARIEYGRIDYSVRAGRPQAWEINLCPTLALSAGGGRESPEKRRQRELYRPARELSHAALLEAFAQIDPGPMAGGDIAPNLPPELEAAVREEKDRTRWQRRHKLCKLALARIPAVNAMRPIVKGAARRVHRLLGDGAEVHVES